MDKADNRKITTLVMITLPDLLALLVGFAAAATDLFQGRIYNKLTYSAALLGLATAVFYKTPSLTQSVAGLVASLLLFFPLYRLSGLGAGDMKLMAAIGAIKGFPFVLYSTFYILCIGTALGILLLAWRGRLVPSLKWVFQTVAGSLIPGIERCDLEGGPTAIPFGPVIFIGIAYCIYLEASRGPLLLQWWI